MNTRPKAYESSALPLSYRATWAGIVREDLEGCPEKIRCFVASFDERSIFRPVSNNTLSYLCLTDPHEIGASSHALICGKETVVVDGGLHPKQVGYDAMPPYKLLDGHDVRSIVLTHAHLDHVGSIPVLQRKFSEARVYLTEATNALADAMLHNSVNVMKSQREELDVMEYPLFTHDQVEELNAVWESRPYERIFETDNPEIELQFQDAGHILGSAAAIVHYKGKRILFSGDVQTHDQTLIKGADLNVEGVDVLVLETTRGNTETRPGFTRESEEQRFAKAIEEALQRGGSILIPVFAMGKSQEVLTMLSQFKAVGMIPNVPIQLGGLGVKMTGIYDSFAKKTRRKTPRFKILRDMQLHVTQKGRRGPIPAQDGKIFCLSSGMMTENTVSNQFARQILHDEKNTILFVGYADPESPGGKIKEAAKGDFISLDDSHKEIPLNCHVESFDFSGHAPREDLLEIAIKSKAKTIILTHGDEPARAWFKAEIEKALPETKIIIPEKGQTYQID